MLIDFSTVLVSSMEANLRENKIYDGEKKVAPLYIETAEEMIRKIKEQLGD